MIYFKDLLVKTHLWACCRRHAGVQKKLSPRNKRVGKVTSTCTNGLRRLGILKVLRSLKHYLQAESQGHTSNRLGERGAERADAQ